MMDYMSREVLELVLHSKYWDNIVDCSFKVFCLADRLLDCLIKLGTSTDWGRFVGLL